jgi:hypothetical protein
VYFVKVVGVFVRFRAPLHGVCKTFAIYVL